MEKYHVMTAIFPIIPASEVKRFGWIKMGQKKLLSTVVSI